MSQTITSLADVADRYDAAFVDLWGCVHNGIDAFPEAVAALKGFRKGGGTVILVTNAPRAHGPVEQQLAQIGVDPDCWDALATSGDSARAAMFTGAVGQKVWFIGQPHEVCFFDPIDVIQDPLEISQVALKDADGIVCCGPEDPLDDPEAYRAEFLLAREMGLKLLCANPDIVVDRGETREWCAGALAKLYTEMGGESLYFGKPHPPIYDLARRRLTALGKDIPDSRILCIGDGPATDIQGAQSEDLDSLFITGGLAAAETGTQVQPDPMMLQTYLAKTMVSPTYSIGKLR